MKIGSLATLALVTLAVTAFAGPPVIDGSAKYDSLYGIDPNDPNNGPNPIVLQDNQTGFGDNSNPSFIYTNGSELDVAYGVVYNDVLYLVLSGNFEANGNKAEIFFDTVPGGQNQLVAHNPDIDFGGLRRMGPLASDPNNFPGLKFQTGFFADYWVMVTQYGNPIIYVNYAELSDPNDPSDPGLGVSLGSASFKCETSGGAITPDPNNPPPAPFDQFLCTIDNSNVLGVEGGSGLAFNPAYGVYTGIELAIPLAAIGNPTEDITITVFINGQQHDFVSNQALGGLGGVGNLGDPRQVDLSTTGHQPFVIPVSSVALGACCVGAVCTVTTEALCTGDYLGDNSNCEGDPCPLGTEVGGCCIQGVCSIKRPADCTNEGGQYLGAGTDCSGCCPSLGACCTDTDPSDPNDQVCTLTLEGDCTGDWLGEFTTCIDNPCAEGACCDPNGVCLLARQEECQNEIGGLYLGDGSTCVGDPCSKGACCIGDFCYVIREEDCDAYGGSYLGDGTTCPGSCGPPPAGLVVMDGAKDGCGTSPYTGYGLPIVVQNTQTEFGNNTNPDIAFANGSELCAAYARIFAGRLQVLLTGNLESNWNKLEIFLDTAPGGSNVVNGLPSGFGNMNGLTFDTGFEPEYIIGAMIGTGGSIDVKADYVAIGDPNDPNNPSVQTYLGNGRAAGDTLDGFMYPDDPNLSGWGNPSASSLILLTIDNSNVAGVSSGTGLIDPNSENPADVLTGYEFSIPLDAIGNPAGAIKICAFVNGTDHNFASNQWLGPLGGGGNLGGNFAAIDLNTIAGNQYFVVEPGPYTCAGDASCDCKVDFGDINPFVDAMLCVGAPDPQACWAALYPGCPYENNDIDGLSGVSFGDINPFVDVLISSSLPVICP